MYSAQSEKSIDVLSGYGMIEEYILYIWLALTTVIYFLLVKYHRSFFSVSQLIDTSPFKYFIGRWFGNLLGALFWSFIMIYILSLFTRDVG